MSLELRPLSDALGVEVVGVDLRDEISDDVRDEILAAWRAHHLVLVRGELRAVDEQAGRLVDGDEMLVGIQDGQRQERSPST